MKTSRVVLTAIVTVALFAAAAPADVKLPSIIDDNMVLQRDAKVRFWGQAAPGEEVTVKIAGQEAKATADKDGKWIVELAPLKASDRPLEATVAGKNTITIENILVGDVWIGSGQSNMTMAVKGVRDAEKEMAAADLPKIRLFNVKQAVADKPQLDVAGKWIVCDPKTVAGFSATLFFFGRELQKPVDVPLGLVHSSWGGTPIEAWTSRARYELDPKLRPILDRWDAELKAHADKLAAATTTRPDAKLPSPAAPGKPTCLFNAMIAPLTPMAVKGVVWYQGESNAGRADLYHAQMPAMIADWRKAFGQEFPFFQVQLANFKARAAEPADSSWARLREAQLKAWQADPKSGMAVIIDIGMADNIHPTNKQDVGKRLALSARAVAYGEKDLVSSGPIYDSMKADGNKLVLSFKHVGGGLTTRYLPEQSPAETAAAPSGFAVAGEDHKFAWAQAEIKGDQVVVWSDKVDKPVAVRYGWADNPACNLYNKEGLPASPFRTDDWPMGK